MAEHTPGPWKVDDRDAGYAACVKSSGNHMLADIWPCGTIEDSLANAQLIAAAPDMLEAIRECLKCLFLFEEFDPVKANDILTWALEKAEGRSK